MSEKTIKFHLQIGRMDISYEGDCSYFDESLLMHVEKMFDIYTSSNKVAENDAEVLNERATETERRKSGLDLSTSTIAARLAAKNGSELAIAACAHLALVKHEISFSRQQILDEMKMATTYYNTNMRGNLTRILEGLIKSKRLNQNATGVYALSATELSSLEARLAQSG